MHSRKKDDFLLSLTIHLRVVHALLLREIITRFGRHGLGVLWLILEPMLFTLGVAGLWYLADMHRVSNIPIIAFAITGYSSVLMWRNTASRCSKAIEPNLALMYHRNVKVLDILLSRVILEWVGSSASIIILTILFSSTGAMHWPANILTAILAWLLLAWFSLSLGLIIGALSERSDTLERTWHIITYLMFPLSGAVFMVHWLPDSAKELLLWVPMVHAVEMLRHGYFGNVVPTYENPIYLFTINIIMLLIGLALVRFIDRRMQL